jgi:hypothetical protein
MDRSPVQGALPNVYDGFTVSEAKSVNTEDEEHITNRIIALALSLSAGITTVNTCVERKAVLFS